MLAIGIVGNFGASRVPVGIVGVRPRDWQDQSGVDRGRSVSVDVRVAPDFAEGVTPLD